jgi:hypothetical protein
MALIKVCETILSGQQKSNAAKSGFVSPLKSVLENYIRKCKVGQGNNKSKVLEARTKSKETYEETLRVKVRGISKMTSHSLDPSSKYAMSYNKTKLTI